MDIIHVVKPRCFLMLINLILCSKFTSGSFIDYKLTSDDPNNLTLECFSSTTGDVDKGATIYYSRELNSAGSRLNGSTFVVTPENEGFFHCNTSDAEHSVFVAIAAVPPNFPEQNLVEIGGATINIDCPIKLGNLYGHLDDYSISWVIINRQGFAIPVDFSLLDFHYSSSSNNRRLTFTVDYSSISNEYRCKLELRRCDILRSNAYYLRSNGPRCSVQSYFGPRTQIFGSFIDYRLTSDDPNNLTLECFSSITGDVDPGATIYYSRELNSTKSRLNGSTFVVTPENEGFFHCTSDAEHSGFQSGAIAAVPPNFPEQNLVEIGGATINIDCPIKLGNLYGHLDDYSISWEIINRQGFIIPVNLSLPDFHYSSSSDNRRLTFTVDESAISNQYRCKLELRRCDILRSNGPRCSVQSYFGPHTQIFGKIQCKVPIDVVPVGEEVVAVGAQYTLRCNTSHRDTLDSSTLMEVIWLDPNNNTIISGTSYTISDVSSTNATTLTSTLTIHQLTVSQAGMYSCAVNLTIPDVVTDFQYISTANVTVRIPPAISVIFQPDRRDVLYIGTVVSLVCVVTFNPELVVESEIKVAFSFDNLMPETTRITISSNASSFQGKVEFSPLLPAHRGITYGCASVTESKNSTSFVVPATNPGANWTLELEDLPPLNVTLTPPSPPVITAGDHLNITCTATVIANLAVAPTLEWLDPFSRDISTGPRNPYSTRTENNTTEFTKMLHFQPLKTSHGGVYTCVARINIPGSIDSLENTMSADVRVQIPPAISVIFQPDRRDILYIGTVVSLVCVVTFNPELVAESEIKVAFSLDNLTPETTRITISSNTSSFQGKVEFSPLLPAHRGMTYGCASVTESKNSTSFVVPATNPAANWTLELEDLPPPNVTLTPPSPPVTTVGDHLNITCTATVIANLAVAPTLEWLDPCSRDITTGLRNPYSTRTENITTEFTKMLHFQPLKTSHGGVYTCVARINIPGSIDSPENTMSAGVRVQMPPPNISFSLDTGENVSSFAGTAANATAIIGTVVSIHGTATLDPLVDSEVTVSRSWVRQGSPDSLVFNVSATTSYVTTSLPFAPLIASAGGYYDFTVRVASPNPVYILPVPSLISNFILIPEPYPPLDIRKSVRGGECEVNETVVLMADVRLLPNTGTSTLSYTWTGTNGQPITPESSEDLIVGGDNNEVLVVKRGRERVGNYNLTACLTVPGTEVDDHCNTVEFMISADVPGQVENLTCPSSSDGSILNIMWQQSDSESVNDYVVEVEEYFLQPGSQSLDSRPLDEPFHEVVRSDGVLATAVMSGIGSAVPYVVKVMPRNALGCGDDMTVQCFTEPGVPLIPPRNVTMSHTTSGTTSGIRINWQLFTLLETRGIIEYIIRLYAVGARKRQDNFQEKRVPMDQDSVTFMNLNANDYEATVGTRSSTLEELEGPESERVNITDPASPTSSPIRPSESSLVVAVSVLGVLIFVVLIPIVFIIALLLRSRRATLKLRKEMKYTRVLNHHYEELTDYSQIPERAPADSLHRVPEYEELRPDQEESQRQLPTVQVVVELNHEYEDIERTTTGEEQAIRRETTDAQSSSQLSSGCTTEATSVNPRRNYPVPTPACSELSNQTCLPNLNLQHGERDALPNEDPHQQDYVYEQTPQVDTVRDAAQEEVGAPMLKIYDASRSSANIHTNPSGQPNVSISRTLSAAGGCEGAQLYEQVPSVNIAQLLSAAGCQHYERVPNVNIAEILSAAGYQHYEQVPNVNIAQMLSATAGSQDYERVPHVNIAEILELSAAGCQEAQVYERVPNVDIARILSTAGCQEAQIYERVPNANLAQILSEVDASKSVEDSPAEQATGYECVKYDERTLQLLRGLVQPYEQISGYERVHYSEAMEEMIVRRMLGEKSESPIQGGV